MKLLNFSLTQLQALVCVVEHGSLNNAAKILNKDRSTVGELINNLEIDLGYPIFDRSIKPMKLLPGMENLVNSARYLIRDAYALATIAEGKFNNQPTEFTLGYSNFISQNILLKIHHFFEKKDIKINLICVERDTAETLLEEGKIDLCLHLAKGNFFHPHLEWKVVGEQIMDVYAAQSFFKEWTSVPYNILTSTVQLLPFYTLNDMTKSILVVSQTTIKINDLSLLTSLLDQGRGWALLPRDIDHIKENTIRVTTDLGKDGFHNNIVALWQKNAIDERLRTQLLAHIEAIYTQDH
ncbi:LysR family transcriptional regulator [Neisseria sp. Ec49-e6-T10]|uniref:LysR family transcriptional regulator n=1 Tax=Neisseria sp. Ec49-e6-T10 TaxID=3140744 RepID=UPI003EBE2E24